MYYGTIILPGRISEMRRRMQWICQPTSPILTCTRNIVMGVVGLRKLTPKAVIPKYNTTTSARSVTVSLMKRIWRWRKSFHGGPSAKSRRRTFQKMHPGTMQRHMRRMHNSTQCISLPRYATKELRYS
jgi:hypothetical protein